MLTKAFLKTLATKAQHLNPVIITGAKGLTPAVHKEIDAALQAHELIKVRVNAEDRDQRLAMITEMAKKNQATIVQKIGHVVVLYREKTE